MIDQPKAPNKKREIGRARSGTALMSQREIGELYGVTLQSVQGVEYRALRKIKEGIEREAAAAGCTVRAWLFGDE
jgi:DNA-directed RNA polymerase sigma subunit (sigma70/sigma32)